MTEDARTGVEWRLETLPRLRSRPCPPPLQSVDAARDDYRPTVRRRRRRIMSTGRAQAGRWSPPEGLAGAGDIGRRSPAGFPSYTSGLSASGRAPGIPFEVRRHRAGLERLGGSDRGTRTSASRCPLEGEPKRARHVVWPDPGPEHGQRLAVSTPTAGPSATSDVALPSALACAAITRHAASGNKIHAGRRPAASIFPRAVQAPGDRLASSLLSPVRPGSGEAGDPRRPGDTAARDRDWL